MSIAQLSEAFLNHHRAVGNSPATIEHYANSLTLFQRFVSDEGVDEPFTNQAMNSFAGWLRETPTRVWRGSTERSIYGTHGALKDVKAWCRWLEAEEYILKTPKIPIPRLPQRLFPILSEDELQQVFESRYLTDRSEQADRNRALLAFMLDTGVRLSEVANLQYDDVTMKEGTALIRGKGKKERFVYFSESVAYELKRWISIRGEDEGSMFWLKAPGVRQLFRRVKNDTGLEMFTPHQIRHTALTMMVKKNMDLHTVKRIAGHASVTTTEACLSLATSDMKAKHDEGSPFRQVITRHEEVREQRRRLRG